MLNQSKLLAGAAAAVVAICSAGAMAGDGKGAVYGDIRWSLNHADASGIGGTAATRGAKQTATNNNSYYGIKGSTSQRGLTVFGAYERTLDNDGAALDFTRQGYVGLKGDMGVLKYGQFGTAYFESGRKLDPFANTAVSGVGSVSAAGASTISSFSSHGLSAALTAEAFGSGFENNQIAYTTPAFGPLTVNAAVFIDETTGEDHDLGLGAEFNQSGISFGVQALDIKSGNLGRAAGTDALRIYGGLNTANFGANVSLERHALPAAADADYIFVSAWLGLSATTRIAAAVGNENETGAEGTSVSLGLFHDVVDNFTSWVAVRRYDGAGGPPAGRSGQTSDVLTVGASYKFNLGFGS